MKRILSLLLCLSLMLAFFPANLTAFASDTEGDSGEVITDVIEDHSGVVDDGTDVEYPEDEPQYDETVFEDPDFTDHDLYTDYSFDADNALQLAEGEYDRETVIVIFKDVSEFPGKEKQYWDEVKKITAWGLDFIEVLNAYVIAVEDLDKNPNAVLNRFKNSKFIESVELNYYANIDFTPNDPTYKSYESIAKMIGAPAGWDIIKGGGPGIAIVDSGVVGVVDLPPLMSGYAAVSGLASGNDSLGHGTKVAGVIGAVGNNGIGTAGINWNATILPVKVDTATGSLTVANIAKGIIWAADNGAKIINLSLGTTADSVTLRNAVDYAYNNGCAIFAATGNSGKNTLEYPARYPNVMAVGATNDGVSRVSYSNYGAGLDVVASGAYYTTSSNGSYAVSSGTSIASPQVAGLASLLYAQGVTAPDAIYDLIRRGASGNGSYLNDNVGYGMINIGKTLEMAGSIPQPGGEALPETQPAPPPNPVITLTGFAEVTYTAGDTYKEDGYKAVDYTGKDITGKVAVTNNLNMKVAGIYTVTYKITDDYGGTATMTRSVKVNPVPAAPPPATAPKITVIGSNPIILHSTSNTPYTEQKAKAIDSDGTDISNLVKVSGTVNRTTPGTYTLTYSVTSPKSGLSASTTRNVRIIAPRENITRMPYGFNGQAKQGAAITHTNIKADAFGWMDLKVSSLDKNMTIKVELIDTATKKAVLTDTFSAAGMKQFKIDPGKYELKVTIDKANGNSSYKIDLLMPEVMTVEFTDVEVPLAFAGAPKIAPIGSNPIILHLGGSPYTEQGARAVNFNDENISDKVEIIGTVNTGKAGVYYITYRVANDLGFEAEATREVRVLAPDEFGNFEDEEVPLVDTPPAPITPISDENVSLLPFYLALAGLFAILAGLYINHTIKKRKTKQ